jgi:TP901 family phage tail tape measure protein
MFDSGALIFRLQTVGAQIFRKDQADAQDALEKTGKAAEESGRKVDKSGDATDKASKKARESKGPLEEQAKSQRKVGEESEDSEKKQRKQKVTTEQQAEAAKKLSIAMLAAGTAVAAVIALSVAKYSEFDKQMSSTSAAIMATQDEQKALSESALEAGADTAYSATEAAAAQEELAKAGQSVASIVGGSLNGALALAAAGQLQVARSAEIMATTLTQFRLPAEQAAHVSDVLAAGAGKAQGSVDDLALALSYVGPLAGSVGFSLNETAGTIAYFATQGIIGEKAGTSLRGVLASLQSPSAAASGVMAEYGINMFDAAGNMLSLAGIAEQLKTKLGGLTQQERLAALGRIFGNESLNAATLLYEGGASAIDEWTDAVNDTGYAAIQAAKRQDNLAGDVEKLGGAFDTALIRTGSGANDVLRTMTQALTELVDMFGEAPAPVQTTALVLGAAAAAALLFSGAAVGLKGKLLELKTQFDLVNSSMSRTALIGGAVGIAIAGIVAVVALLAQQQAEARAKAEAYADTLEAGTQKITKATREMAAENLAAKRMQLWWESDSAYDKAEKLGISLDTITDAAVGNVDALKSLQKQTDAIMSQQFESQDAYESTKGAVDVVTNAVKGESDSLTEAIRVAEQKNKVTEDGVPVTKTATQAYVEAGSAVKDLNSQLSELIDKVMEANGIGQDAVSANIDYQDALRKVGEQIDNINNGAEGYAAGLDIATEAGSRNLDILNDLAEKSQDAAEKQFQLDGNTDQYRQTLEAGRQTLIDRAQQLGANADEAQALADQIYRIPSDTEWKLIADTQDAAAKIGTIEAAIQRLTGTRTVTIDMIQQYGPISPQYAQQLIPQANGGVVKFFADGGVENRVAQIARAGAIRVWNEPETGGEAYVPLSPSKRGRSEQVMQETASVFGGTYTPAGQSTQTTVVVKPKGGINLLDYIDIQVQAQPTLNDMVRGGR